MQFPMRFVSRLCGLIANISFQPVRPLHARFQSNLDWAEIGVDSPSPVARRSIPLPNLADEDEDEEVMRFVRYYYPSSTH